MEDRATRLAFDAASAASPWPVIILLAALGILGLAIAVLLVAWLRGAFPRAVPARAGTTLWFLAAFALIWGAALSFGAVHQTIRERALQAELAAGRVQVVEGCLDHFENLVGNFRGYSSTEHWRVAGREFRYDHGDVGSSFHQPRADGGPMTPDSRVRVGFVSDTISGGDRIVRLEIARGACPPAPEQPR